MQTELQYQELLKYVNVSRETFNKLCIYQKLLEKWNKSINLVGRSTIETCWERHFLDSAQLWPSKWEFDSWVDLGAGAGFPGLVLAIIGAELCPQAEFHLVESDTRKCAFLRNVSRETKVKVKVQNCRIEDLPENKYDVVSARALAPLDKLLKFAEKIISPSGKCLFLKGKNFDRELKDAKLNWEFRLERTQSIIQNESSVLLIGEIQRAKPA